MELLPTGFSTFSSSSSSSTDNDEEKASLLGLFEANSCAMIKMLREEDAQLNKHRGSVVGRAYIRRKRKIGHDLLFCEYFAEDPVHPPSAFRRRFRMRRELFMRILHAIEEHCPYFVQKQDACHVLGLSSLQKMASAIKMLAYGLPADGVDDHIKIGESTAILSFKTFCRSIIEIYGTEYLRSPNANDISRLLAMGEARGFPGMLGSLDCMHWEWKSCPKAWHGQYSGHVKKPTIILEAVASQDLWIWHAFFGMPGSHNDLNVLDRSHLFDELGQGRAPPANYSINGHPYNLGYYLADGIYPSWATIVQTITSPEGPKKQYFAKMQEGARKDVERAFGVLQSRFAIVAGPARFWDPEFLGEIMKTCIILHNMIVEDERDVYTDFSYDTVERNEPVELLQERNNDFESFMSRHVQIRDSNVYHALRDDLIDHLWQRYGEM